MYRFNMNEIANGATIKSIDSERNFLVKENISSNGENGFKIEGLFRNGATFIYYPGKNDCLKYMYSSRFGGKYYVVSVREEDGIVTFDHELRTKAKVS